MNSTRARESYWANRWAIGLLATLLQLPICSRGDAGDEGDIQPGVIQPAMEQLISFQQGVAGYEGTVDTEIWALAPKTILNANPNASSDENNDGGENQVLMRFEGIIGTGSRQIPPRSTVLSAQLIVSAFDQGTTVNLHRMLVPFDATATWDSLIAGISADGFEASRHKDGFTFGKIAASSSGAVFDVSDTLQAWVNGQANHGWVFLNTGGNGWDFYVSEFDKVSQRPKLVVRFQPHVRDTEVRVADATAANSKSESSKSNVAGTGPVR